ncbi:MAG: indole-3-glycerol-phosphate synthase TrpC [Thermoplasmata archaeon]|nr:indole-3-glycerol-phosphate synthase TrpC [Thermoplasmata archaeon]
MGFLREMVAATTAAVSQPEYLESLPRRPARPPASLRSAVREAAPSGAVLAEYKRRSPGASTPELPPRTIAAFLERTTVPEVVAYSCLASGPRFGGAPQDVADLAARTPKPVLFKDFVVDPLQITAAARAGASAILLIARLEVEGLLPVPLHELADRAHREGLEVLLEWHGRAELRRTEDVPADVFGVNVRDLDTLELRRPVAEETLRAAGAFRPMVGMSGVEGPKEARRFWDLGVDGILVGGALARTHDPSGFLSQLRRPPRETAR